MGRESKWRGSSFGVVYSKDGRYGISKRLGEFHGYIHYPNSEGREVEYVLERFASFDAPAPPEELGSFESVKLAKEFLEKEGVN